MTSVCSLEKFINDFGMSDFSRLMEIQAPPSQEVFVARLYKEIDDLLESFESGRKERKGDSEDRISSEIVMNLRGRGYVAIKDPTQGGHVDVYVQPGKRNGYSWYGEAKIWRGKEYVEGGLSQLLTRYATGRHLNLGLIIYIRDLPIIEKLETWANHIESERCEGFQSKTSVNAFKFDSIHAHGSGASITVRHFGVNVSWDVS